MVLADVGRARAAVRNVTGHPNRFGFGAFGFLEGLATLAAESHSLANMVQVESLGIILNIFFFLGRATLREFGVSWSVTRTRMELLGLWNHFPFYPYP